MALIDTHCHLDVAEFDSDRAAVLARTRAAGVTGLVIPAIHRAGWLGPLGWRWRPPPASWARSAG